MSSSSGFVRFSGRCRIMPLGIGFENEDDDDGRPGGRMLWVEGRGAAGKKAKMLPFCCAKWLSDNGVTDVTDV